MHKVIKRHEWWGGVPLSIAYQDNSVWGWGRGEFSGLKVHWLYQQYLSSLLSEYKDQRKSPWIAWQMHCLSHHFPIQLTEYQPPVMNQLAAGFVVMLSKSANENTKWRWHQTGHYSLQHTQGNSCKLVHIIMMYNELILNNTFGVSIFLINPFGLHENENFVTMAEIIYNIIARNCQQKKFIR